MCIIYVYVKFKTKKAEIISIIGRASGTLEIISKNVLAAIVNDFITMQMLKNEKIRFTSAR